MNQGGVIAVSCRFSWLILIVVRDI